MKTIHKIQTKKVKDMSVGEKWSTIKSISPIYDSLNPPNRKKFHTCLHVALEKYTKCKIDRHYIIRYFRSAIYHAYKQAENNRITLATDQALNVWFIAFKDVQIDLDNIKIA